MPRLLRFHSMKGAPSPSMKGGVAAHGIALRAFDLDDVGAEIAELHAAERARQMRRQVEDHQAVEGACHLPSMPG